MLNEPSTRAHRFEARRLSVRLGFVGAAVLAVVAAALAGAQPLSVVASLSSGGDPGITAVDGGGSPQTSEEPPAQWQNHHWDDPWLPLPHPLAGGPDSPSPMAPPPNGAGAPVTGLGGPPGGPSIPDATSSVPQATRGVPGGGVPGSGVPGGGVAGPTRDPVAAGPGEPTTGLGDPVDPTTPAPGPATPVVTPIAAPVPVPASNEEDVSSSAAYHRSLMLSGLGGLLLTAAGFAIISYRRRHW